jgi:hypothetical protein
MENPEKTERGNQEWRIQRKPKGAIKNGESRDTGNMGYTRHSMKTSKRKNTTQKTKKMSNTDPKKPGGERVRSSCLLVDT